MSSEISDFVLIGDFPMRFMFENPDVYCKPVVSLEKIEK